MSGDRRWTGGVANREWQSGARLEQPLDEDYITGQVKAYLRDCRRSPHLDPKYHPTASGAVKVVYGPEQAVRAAYRHLTGARPEQEDRYGMS